MSIKIVEKNSFREKVKENDKLQIENIIKFLDNILFIIDYKFLGKKGLRYAFENFDYIATPSFERVNIVITLFKEEIINIEEHRQEIVNGNFRFENVHIKGIEEPIKLDISFIQKSDKLDYSSDEVLRDRLTSIKEQHPEEYNLVLANIIEAKRILKEGEIYKKQ